MNITTIKSNWEYVTESLISGILSIYIIFEGIIMLPAFNQLKDWLAGSEGATGLLIIPLAPLSFLATILGIIFLLIGFILIAISIGIYKKNRLSVIAFSILILIITFFAGFNIVLSIATIVSIILAIKILYKNKSVKI